MARAVTCLDTNFLILGLAHGSTEARALVAWKQADEPLITPALAWFEFLCGPVSDPQIHTMRTFIDEIIVFGEPQAEESARLFNAIGRRRHLRVDSIIAGTAVVAGANLATNNRADFRVFVPHGLHLV